MRVMIVVTHLLGTGHLRRASVLARAFANAGHDVLLASGGMPIGDLDLDGAELVQLPPVRSDGVNFSRLLTSDGKRVPETYLTGRQDLLSSELRRFSPDCLITELYPFGRRILAREFNLLLDTAREMTLPPITLSSIRDILAPPSHPGKATLADELIDRYYDAVLVHSDPDATRLEQSWPVSDALSEKLRYTGYIAPASPDAPAVREGRREVLVSAGGGSVGAPLFACANEAARRMPDLRWRFLVPEPNKDLRQVLAGNAAPNVTVEPNRADFRQILGEAVASVSLCGYNTALDVLQSGAPAVFVPFDDGNEVEQSLRAAGLSHLPGIRVLKSADLTPQALCEDVANVISAPKRATSGLRFDGAAQSVAIAVAMAQARA